MKNSKIIMLLTSACLLFSCSKISKTSSSPSINVYEEAIEVYNDGNYPFLLQTSKDLSKDATQYVYTLTFIYNGVRLDNFKVIFGVESIKSNNKSYTFGYSNKCNLAEETSYEKNDFKGANISYQSKMDHETFYVHVESSYNSNSTYNFKISID